MFIGNSIRIYGEKTMSFEVAEIDPNKFMMYQFRKSLRESNIAGQIKLAEDIKKKLPHNGTVKNALQVTKEEIEKYLKTNPSEQILSDMLVWLETALKEIKN